MIKEWQISELACSQKIELEAQFITHLNISRNKYSKASIISKYSSILNKDNPDVLEQQEHSSALDLSKFHTPHHSRLRTKSFFKTKMDASQNFEDEVQKSDQQSEFEQISFKNTNPKVETPVEPIDSDGKDEVESLQRVDTVSSNDATVIKDLTERIHMMNLKFTDNYDTLTNYVKKTFTDKFDEIKLTIKLWKNELQEYISTLHNDVDSVSNANKVFKEGTKCLIYKFITYSPSYIFCIDIYDRIRTQRKIIGDLNVKLTSIYNTIQKLSALTSSLTPQASIELSTIDK